MRDGALIPTIAPQLRAGRLAQDAELIVRHYGTAPGKAPLYDDDGETFDYENGQFAWYELNSPDGSTGTITKRAGDWAGTFCKATWIHIGNSAYANE